MRAILLIPILLLLSSYKPCYYKGHKLYGRVQIVSFGEDLKVQIVPNFADLEVRLVNSMPTQCGEWQLVHSMPDLKIRLVNYGEDIKIKIR